MCAKNDRAFWNRLVRYCYCVQSGCAIIWVRSARTKNRTPSHFVCQAGKQTCKDLHICTMVWCIGNIGNGYELNNNKGKTD